MNIFNKCLFSSSDMNGCGWIRSFLPAKYLEANFLGGFDRNNLYSDVDHFFFQRQSNQDFKTIIPNLKQISKKVYYDLDDDVWTISDNNPAKNFYNEKVISNIEEIISMCDGVFVSTDTLKERVLKFNNNVHIIPNLIEIPISQKQEKNKIRIGYAGSKSHVGDFSDKLIYSLIKLHKKYSSKIEFVFLGYVPEALRNHVTYIDGVEAPYYIHSLNFLDFDISLIPLKDTIFNKSKSNLKWLDSSICRSCPVASDVYCYSEIEDNVTGIKIQDEKWYDVLEELIFNTELRQSISYQSQQHVLQNYTWQNAKYKQEDVYRSVL